MYRNNRYNWVTIGVMAGFHALALSAFWQPFKPVYALVGIGMYLWIGFATTFLLHRHLTHRAFETTGWLRGFFCLANAVGMQGDPVGWVGHHRWHHAHSDREKDVHSPRAGFFQAHMGWILRDGGAEDHELRALATDLRQKYPYMRWLEHKPLLFAIHLAAAAVLFSTLGFGGMVWGLYVPMVALYHMTWFVNSVCHTPGVGSRPTETTDDSRNVWWVGILGLGEGWHNNHHACQTRAAMGIHWWQIDATNYLIAGLEKVGLVWNVRWKAPERTPAAPAAEPALV